MTAKFRRSRNFWLCLILVIQVSGLLGQAVAWAAAQQRGQAVERGTLTQVLGHAVAICHHGEPGHDAPQSGGADDCCATGLCHCLAHALVVPSSSIAVVARGSATGTRSPARVAARGASRNAGPNGARAPPFFV